jgi:2-polyprenyl-3-methyl-5-hydroxy-6-metoxy-1,4-benzoquinol methylase/uncharacterized protein YbaR (Trm112 family)
MKIIACPKCLGSLELKDEVSETEEIINGRLYCSGCKLDFIIKDGVAVFGIEARNIEDRFREINGENRWVFSEIELQEHVDFAKKSSQAGERMIRKLIERLKKKRKLRVLDVGAGWGCFQSWQFAKHGFEVVATELCPEFILASNCGPEDVFFERIITDCVTLPFSDGSYDIVFCKELIHHVNNPMDLLSEMWRVCSPNGLIIIREPCAPILLKKILAKKDQASKVGITHYYYSYRDYVRYMNRITSELEIDGEVNIISSSRHYILHTLQKLILTIGIIPFCRNFIIKLNLIFIGGPLEVIGTKKREYMKHNLDNRDIIPIDIRTSDVQQIEFYRTELIPKVLKVFSETYKKYKEESIGGNANK